jgi:Mannosyltransferase OCH1 and related enzymes
MKNTVIQGLWIGPELSAMERMSISSFITHGHDYHLYVYDDVKNVPPGAIVKDAGEVLPSSMIFEYRSFKSYAGFSNYFRYKLLLDKGGWWVDTDIICLKPFDFDDEHVFSTEIDDGVEQITSGVIKAPAASAVMSYAWDVCQMKDPQKLMWGETGPRLMADAVGKFSLERFVRPPQTFCPIDHADWQKVIEPDATWKLDESMYAIHLWNEMWRRVGMDKNQEYHRDSFYERLKRKYLLA